MDRLREFSVSEYLIGFLEESVPSFMNSMHTLKVINETRYRMPYWVLRKSKYSKLRLLFRRKCLREVRGKWRYLKGNM
jgi:hypothetical protein